MNALQNERIANVRRHLLKAQEELLGLHREGGLTYEQYSQVANLVVDTEQALTALLAGKEAPTIESQCLPIPLWLFTNTQISPLAKWTYSHLLKIRREVCRPGKNALVIDLQLVSKDIFPTYAWTQKHLIDALRELTEAGIITSRKMEYPDTTPEQWEIDFLQEIRRSYSKRGDTHEHPNLSPES